MGCNTSKSTATGGMGVAESTVTATKATNMDKKPVPGKVNLYINYLSMPSRSVLMTAKCLGLDMVVHNIDLSKGEHKHPMYLKHINPKGQVPAIVDSDGTTLNESAVIATYLVNKYGKDSKLLGDSAETRAKVEEMLAREPDLASCVFPVVLLVIGFSKNSPTQDQFDKLLAITDEVEIILGQKKFLCGSYVTLADIFFFNHIIQIVKLTGFRGVHPNIIRWFQDMQGIGGFSDGPLPALDKAAAGIKEKMPTLWFDVLSPPTRTVRMISEHLALPINFRPLNLFAGENKTNEEFMKLQPAKTLPTLQIGPNEAIGDSNPIAFHLVEKFGNKTGLDGVDDEHKTRVKNLLSSEAKFRNCVNEFVGAAFGGPAPSEDSKKLIATDLEHMDGMLDKSKYLTGEKITIVDYFVFNTILTLCEMSGYELTGDNNKRFIEDMKAQRAAKATYKEFREALAKLQG